MILNTVLLAAGGGMMETFLFMAALIAIMYFFMIRPQQKKQKAIEKARQALKVGDRVVTAGGIHGKIKDIKDTTFLIEISDGVRIKIEKTSVHPAGTSTEDTPTPPDTSKN
ncbi:preprotein translocase subunit YajC [Dysgonomonas sp. 520]|uniref:preprotein translocase subunit YajC n=1 Tax=Dysgonomonas sp. 520 TaxID=2302931 RepID=UPI0013CF56C7|nr:preprotein translocase subunit YajC [Dysgonomonas sp. 520]NDW09881.1 preprotein translocase subunit YajC [Dysgonomonas sp. 520]